MNKMLVWILCACVYSGFHGMSCLDAQEIEVATRGRIEDRIRTRLAEIHAESGFPGGSFAITLPDRSQITAVVGESSVEQQQPLKSSDRFMSGSIGKTYFAAIALDLVRQERLSLDDKVSKFLGGREWYFRIPNREELSVASLMRHQSGLPRYIQNRKLWTDLLAHPDKKWSNGEQLTYIYDANPLFGVGQGWSYSDTNYILLGLVLEEILDQSLYDFACDSFLKPNGLFDTVPNNQRQIPGLVQGYTNTFRMLGVPKLVISDGKFVFKPAMEWCGGGFASNAADLANWAHIFLSGDLLPGEYVEKMTAKAVVAKTLGQGTKYGLGVMIRETEFGTLLGHDGVFPGYTSTMGFFPNQKIAAAFMFNSDGALAINRPSHEVLVELAGLAIAEIEKQNKRSELPESKVLKRLGVQTGEGFCSKVKRRFYPGMAEVKVSSQTCTGAFSMITQFPYTLWLESTVPRPDKEARIFDRRSAGGFGGLFGSRKPYGKELETLSREAAKDLAFKPIPESRLVALKRRPHEQTLQRRLEEYVQAHRELGYFSGAVLVAHRGRVLLRQFHGMSDWDHEIPISGQSRFRLASVTKPIVASAILQLVDQGKIDLDQSVKSYLPNFSHARAGDIKIRNLLSHNSGIIRDVERMTEKGMADQFRMPELVDLIGHSDLRFEPGERFEYSNAGYVLLAAILESVTGEPFETAIDSLVFQPLGMHNSGHELNTQLLKHRVRGYIRLPDGHVNAAFENKSYVTGAGSLYSTVDDLWIWCQAMDGSDFVSNKMKQQVFVNQTPNESFESYGMGWFLKDNGNLFDKPRAIRKRVVSHGGSCPGFLTGIVKYLDHEVTVIFLSNAKPSNFVNNDSTALQQYRMASGLADMVIGLDPQKPSEAPLYHVVRVALKDGAKVAQQEIEDLQDSTGYVANVNQINAMGYAYLHSNQTSKAKSLFELYSRVAPNDANAWDSLAEGCAANGDYAEAIGNYKKSLELNNVNAFAREMLLKLKSLTK